MVDKSPVIENGSLVRPSDIAGALENVRRSAEETDQQQELKAAGQAAPRVKTTLANLIVLSANSSQGVQKKALDSLVTELCISHPSRFFLIEFCDEVIPADQDKDYYNGVRSFVSSRCVLAHSGSHVCSEEIHLTVKKEGVKLIPGLVRSLLVPDVEVALLVLDGGINRADSTGSAVSPVTTIDGRSELLDGLRSIIDAVIYDSSLLGHLNFELPALLGLDTESYIPGSSLTLDDSPKVKDLNYRRTRKWRELIAEGFDNERLSAEDSTISEIVLSCSTKENTEKGTPWHPSNDSLLLAGWIAKCLDWKIVKNGIKASPTDLKVSMTSSGKATGITFQQSASKNDILSNSALSAVEIFVRDNKSSKNSRSLQIKRSEGSENAEISFHDETTQSGSAERCDFFCRSVPFSQLPLTDLVLRGILPQRGDEGFEDALSFALQVSEQISK